MEVKKNFVKRSENDLERTYLLFKDKFEKLAEKHAAQAQKLAKVQEEEFDELYEECKSALSEEEMSYIEKKRNDEVKIKSKKIIDEVASMVYEALKEFEKNDN